MSIIDRLFRKKRIQTALDGNGLRTQDIPTKKTTEEVISVSGKGALSKIVELHHDKNVHSLSLMNGGTLLAKVYPDMKKEDLEFVLMAAQFHLSSVRFTITFVIERYEKDSRQEKNKAASEEEHVQNIVKGADPVQDAFKERQYMAEHPCNCGGSWQRVQGGSAFPKFVYSLCKCGKCGNQKRFTFYF